MSFFILYSYQQTEISSLLILSLTRQCVQKSLSSENKTYTLRSSTVNIHLSGFFSKYEIFINMNTCYLLTMNTVKSIFPGYLSSSNHLQGRI